MAENDTSPTANRLIVTHQTSKVKFLVDTRADVCVYPKRLVKRPTKSSTYKLYAVNKAKLDTYGTISTRLDLRLQRQFIKTFVIANTHKPVIGASFLAHKGLLVDIK